jgi:hypothetical protein
MPHGSFLLFANLFRFVFDLLELCELSEGGLGVFI